MISRPPLHRYPCSKIESEKKMQVLEKKLEKEHEDKIGALRERQELELRMRP